VLAGARALRMHDVAAARQAVDVAAAIRDAQRRDP
jgi:dihydropteroate synthase